MGLYDNHPGTSNNNNKARPLSIDDMPAWMRREKAQQAYKDSSKTITDKLKAFFQKLIK